MKLKLGKKLVIGLDSMIIIIGLGYYCLYSDGHLEGEACMSRTKQMGLALLDYSSDNNDTLPPAESWMDLIAAHLGTPSDLHDSAGVPENGYGYAFRDRATSMRLSTISHAGNSS